VPSLGQKHPPRISWLWIVTPSYSTTIVLTGLSDRRSCFALHHQPASRPRVSVGELASRRSGWALVCLRKGNSTPMVVFWESARPRLPCRGSVDSTQRFKADTAKRFWFTPTANRPMPRLYATSSEATLEVRNPPPAHRQIQMSAGSLRPANGSCQWLPGLSWSPWH